MCFSDEKVSVDRADHRHRVRSARHVDIVVTELGELDYGLEVAPVAADAIRTSRRVASGFPRIDD